MRKNNTLVKRLMAVIMMVAMAVAVAVLPQSVQAATVSITPNDFTTYTGATFQMKVKGSYKKVTWKSSNKNALSITSKGRVTAKKAGSGEITATITLKNGKKVTRYSGFEVENAGKLITVKEADNEMAEQIKEYLDSTTPFSLVYYGSESDAKKVVNNLRKKIGKLNEYGVLFQYDDSRSADPEDYPVYGSARKGYLFRVTKSDCKLYQYSVKFYKRLVKEAIYSWFCDDSEGLNDPNAFAPDGRLAFARKFNTWQEYQAAVNANDYKDDEGCIVNNLNPNGCTDDNDLRRCWLLANTKFCDMSQAMKVWTIDSTGFFAGGEWVRDLGYLCMVYGDPAGATRYQSEATQMKNMAENKAVGVCDDFARCEVTAFKQLGIKAKYDRDGGHAWSVVYPTNADGKKLQYIFNYRLEYDDDSCHGHSGSKSDIY